MKRQRRPGCAPVAFAIAMMALAQPDARAQSAAPVPHAAAARAIDIPSQPLGDALNAWASQTGGRVAVQQSLVAGRRAPAVSGSLTPRQALDRLLAGSGLAATLDGAEAVVRRAPAADPSGPTLSAVTVTAAATPAQESATNYTVSQSSSAAKLDLALKETPQSISVFTEKLIQDMNLTSVSDVLQYTPGVTVIENGVPGAGRVEYYSRGFAINSFQIDGLMTDGAAFGAQNNAANRTAIGMQDPFLYERIDIIRGSTGLTTGQGDPSASLGFVRKKPLKERHIEANLKYGSWNTRRAELDFSTPVNASGSWRARLAATRDQGDAYIDRVKQKGTALYGVTELDITPLTKLSLGASQISRRLDGAGPHGATRIKVNHGFSIASEQGRGYNNATQWSYRDFDYSNVFATLDHSFSNGWQIIAAYNRFSTKSDRLYGVMGSQWSLPSWDVASYIWGREKYENATNAYDVYLKGGLTLLGREHDFVIGANQTQSERTNHGYPQWSDSVRPSNLASVDNPNSAGWRLEYWMRPSAWNDGGVPMPALTNPNWAVSALNYSWNAPYRTNVDKRKQQGIYASTRLRPLEHLQVILGGRYGRNEQVHSSKEPTTFEPYGGVIYELTPSINAYASYARVEKPNFSESGRLISVDGSFLDPLQGNTIEAGVKGGFYENRLNLAATYFTMTQDNFPVETNLWVEDPDYPGAYQNAWAGINGYRVYGMEFSAAGQITPRWAVMAGYVHQRQKIPSDFWGMQLGDDFEGQFFFPKNSLKLFTTYDLGSSGQYTLGGGLTWQSAGRNTIRVINTDGSQSYWWQGSYALYNLMARWRVHKHATLGVNVNNLFDKKYFTNSNAGNYGPPRNIMASLNMKF